MTAPRSPGRIARDALGLGLRPSFLRALREGPVAVDFFEVIAENHLGESDVPRANLGWVAERYPIAVHGVGMNLLGATPLDHEHLAGLSALALRHDADFITDHLCWTRSGNRHHHDLLPVPSCTELIPYAAARIREAQGALGVPFGIENVSTYLRFAQDELPEWEFLARVAEEADCGLLVDLNNIVVSSVNHGFDPSSYLDGIPWDRVLYVHLAGHEVRPDGLRHDTHDRQVDAAVWALYAEAWRRAGPFPTLLEWDTNIPDLTVLLRELERAREVRR